MWKGPSWVLLLLRPYWRCYFPNTQAIIYVVDSSDTDRLVVAKEEFHAILEVPFPCCSNICSVFEFIRFLLRSIDAKYEVSFFVGILITDTVNTKQP